jgi:hypothetical protein
MKQKTFIEIRRSLEVKGITWGGFKSTYIYPLGSLPEPKTMAEATRKAGDFQSLTSAKIVTAWVETKIKETPIK